MSYNLYDNGFEFFNQYNFLITYTVYIYIIFNTCIFNYYSNDFIIILFILGIENMNELEISRSQYGIEVQVNLKHKFFEKVGNSLVAKLSSNPKKKTCIKLSER